MGGQRVNFTDIYAVDAMVADGLTAKNTCGKLYAVLLFHLGRPENCLKNTVSVNSGVQKVSGGRTIQEAGDASVH